MKLFIEKILPRLFKILLIAGYLYGVVAVIVNAVERTNALDEVTEEMKTCCCPPNVEFNLAVCKFFKGPDPIFEVYDNRFQSKNVAHSLAVLEPIIGLLFILMMVVLV